MRAGAKLGPYRRIEETTEALREIFGFSALEITGNYQRDDFLVKIDGKRYNLSAIGAGFAQFLLVFANLATPQPLIRPDRRA